MMSSGSIELQECCRGLESPKVTERKKSVDTLLRLLESGVAANVLNNKSGGSKKGLSWDVVFYTIHKLILKDAEKIEEDERKKKGGGLPVVKKNYGDLLISIVRIANTKESRLSINILLESTQQYFKSNSLRKYFSKVYITILKDFILPTRAYWPKIKAIEWKWLIVYLKDLIQNPVPGLEEVKPLQCFHLIIQWGLLHALQSTDLQQEFCFMLKIALQINGSSPRLQQEVVLKMLIDFCNQTAKDNRLSCCNLGEKLFENFITLYQSQNGDSIKLLILKFLLLQVQIHHPNGCIEGSISAYACSWHEWHKNLRRLYTMLCDQMNNNMQIKFKSAAVFVGQNLLDITFVTLLVEIFKQIFTGIKNNVDVSQASDINEPPFKRKKIEGGIPALISNIQENKDWPWINIMTELLRKYPNLISVTDFLQLLQVLSTLQTECKNVHVRFHIYQCLTIMVDIETNFHFNQATDGVDSLWSIVWDSTLRAVGLNENEEQTHKLMQNLISKNKISNATQLFRPYFSQVLNVSKSSINTLNIACSHFDIPDMTAINNSIYLENTKHTLVNWILNEKCSDAAVFSEVITAQVLLYLTFKQWPHISIKCNEPNNSTDLEHIYLLTTFDEELIFTVNNSSQIADVHNSECVYCIDMVKYLIDALSNFAETFLNDNNKQFIGLKNLLHVTTLLANFLSLMLQYNIMKLGDVDDHKLVDVIRLLLTEISKLMTSAIKQINEKNMNSVQEILKQTKQLFSLNIHNDLLKTLRQMVPSSLLQEIFVVLNSAEEVECKNIDFESYKNGVFQFYSKTIDHELINVLCSFCHVSSERYLFTTQQQILEAIAISEFDETILKDCETTITFLTQMSKFNPGTLSITILDNALKSIHRITAVHYDYALNLVQILYDLYQHIAITDNEKLQKTTVKVFHPFYSSHLSYGPNVIVAIVNCMTQFVKHDINVTWQSETDENGKRLILDIPNFLTSDYQEVRIAAIKNLQIVFSLPCEDNTRMNQFILLFNVVCEKCTEVFQVDCFITEERKVDETVTRTATALHALTSIMTTNAILRQKCLFALLELVYNKKLNMDSTQRVLEMAARRLSLNDVNTLIENNLNYLVCQWHCKNYELKDFPYNLLGCSTETEFLAKHALLLIPVLIMNDIPLLTNICEQHGKSQTEILEVCYPAIIARYFLSITSEVLSNTEVEINKKAHQNLDDMLTHTRMNELLLEMLDEVLGHIIQHCFDPNNINIKFETNCILPEPHRPYFEVTDICKAFNYIEVNCLNEDSVILYGVRKCPRILQKLLLKLITRVHQSLNTEEKIKAFHHVTIFVDLVVPWLDVAHDFSTYFIRSVSHSFLHLIRDNCKTDSVLNVMFCKYFSTFISNILPKNSDILEKYLVIFVSILIPVARFENTLGVECTLLLNNLIVNHTKELMNGIKTLDPFPPEERFTDMQNVFKKVKYDSQTLSLEDEIKSFLLTGNLMGSSGNRTEGLRYLKTQLSIKKVELKELYAALYNVRGFTEDCKQSILHCLIKMLVTLSLSSDVNEGLEATRCLGELGPADLLTTILQVEQKYEHKKCNQFELVTGNVIPLLIQYIIDFNIDVIHVASDALYHVLDCKEAKLVLVSDFDYGQGIIQKAYISPFISGRRISAATSYDIKNNFEEIVNCNELWCPNSLCSHSEWITRLICNILQTFKDTCYLKNLIPVCKAKVEFAEHLLPLVVYLILFSKYADKVSTQIRRFFEMHWTVSFCGRSRDELVVVNKQSVQCMLNVVHFIRVRKNVETSKNFGNLKLNYLHVAQAAQFCTAHFTALLYVDLWYQERIKEIRKRLITPTISAGLSPLESIFKYETPEIQEALQNILKQGYKRVGELDAARSCRTADLLNAQPCIEHYENLGHWEQVALIYDVQVSHGDNSSVPKLLSALKNCSFYELPLKYDGSSEPQFECAWRLSNWNITKIDSKDTESYNKHQYFALKALHDNDKFSFFTALTDARTCVINSLRHASIESSKNLYEPLSQFQALIELEDFFANMNENNIDGLLSKWKTQDEINRNAFEYVEPIKAQRIAVLCNLPEAKYNTKDSVVDMYLKLAVLARVEGKHYTANRTLRNLLHISDLTPEIRNQIMMEQAQMYWLNDRAAARYTLHHLLSKSPSPRLQAAALKLYGTWMVETCSENPQTIISDYFVESLNILNRLEKNDGDNANICETYDILARFADLQYQQVLSYMKSAVFETKVQYMKKSKQTAQDIRNQCNGKPTLDESKAICTHERQSSIDQIEIENTKTERSNYLRMAMQHYLLNVRHTDVNNVRMFRIFSLWLENRLDPDITKLVSSNLIDIPSYKYIPILPQLVPHISSNKDEPFGYQITAIIERCANDHPHHTIPIILALAHSNGDRLYNKSKTNTASNEPRIASAEKLIEKFKLSRHPLKQMVERMEIVSKALIQLAYVEIDDCRRKNKETIYIPDKSAIKKIQNFDNVLVPTYSLPIKKNCKYSNIIGIHSFNNTFSPVGGVNVPKRITCLGTDGILRRQLVKGKDDLRQDAVMQQVFTIMNGLLACNKQTENLIIRTYKVVPLSQRSGILEWVENSIPLAVYLVGEDTTVGAHVQYNINDITPLKCRSLIKNAAKLDNDYKLKVYQDVCRQFNPVFHKFFETSFVEPAIWYERRRAYMYSVATSSMCGYILGLGDRHVQNILIDKITAEVIHIDFGIAFEQGKILPTKETVPFRLTRDIEDGMGISGIEGVFRKSCEKTLDVLRNNSETIISILEVLLYDPLYAWTITPAEAYSHQFNHDFDATSNEPIEFSDGENVPVNITAERALIRLRQKLQGTEEGSSSSIEGQVERLIQQARDPSNLSRLFDGWQAYL